MYLKLIDPQIINFSNYKSTFDPQLQSQFGYCLNDKIYGGPCKLNEQNI